jgi:hypothetical protein
MDFVTLYGEQLTAELGTSDTAQRFTLVRRKAALNEAQTDVIKKTECCVKWVEIAVVDGTAEYDLEANVPNYLRIATAGPSLKMVDASANERYVEGPDSFPQMSPPLLNRQQPGWRANPDSTPAAWYLRRHLGLLYFGVVPGPDIPSGETWTLLIPCVVKAADMVDDTDEPFTVSGGTAPASLSVLHKALVHHAAFLLEKLRKDPTRMKLQAELYAAQIAEYRGDDRPKGGKMIQMARNYRQHQRAGWTRYSVNADSVV